MADGDTVGTNAGPWSSEHRDLQFSFDSVDTRRGGMQSAGGTEPI